MKGRRNHSRNRNQTRSVMGGKSVLEGKETSITHQEETRGPRKPQVNRKELGLPLRGMQEAHERILQWKKNSAGEKKRSLTSAEM